MSRIDLCKKCLNRECNLNEDGIRCSLTHEKPAFETTCMQYQEDVQKKIDDEEYLKRKERGQYPLVLKIIGTIVLVRAIYLIFRLLFTGLFTTL